MNKILDFKRHQWSVADRTSAALLLVTIALLWIKGYPAPYCDDLFFLGAGISLANGEGLINPLIQPWLDFYGTKSFLLQPPGHPFLTSFWLRLFGISELSVRLFQWLVLIAGTLFFYRYLMQFGVSRVVCLIAGIAYLLAFQRDGLRPEVAAFTLMFAGVTLLRGRHMLVSLAAWLVLGYSALCYPITVFAAPALIMGQWSLQNRLNPKLWLHTIKSHALHFMAAVCITVLMLHLMIDGQWLELARCLEISKGIATPGIGLPNLSWHWLRATSNAQMYITMPFYALAAFMTILSQIWRSRYQVGIRILLPALMICVILSAAGSPLASLGFCKALCLTVTAIGITSGYMLPKTLHLPAFAGIVAIAHPFYVIGLLFQRPPSNTDYAELRTAAEHEISEGERLIIDETSARFVFDYQLPKGALDATCYKTEYLFDRLKEPRMRGVDKSKVGKVRNQILSYKNKPDTDTWILSKARLVWVIEDFPPDIQKSWSVVNLFGKPINTVPVSPFKVIITD